MKALIKYGKSIHAQAPETAIKDKAKSYLSESYICPSSVLGDVAEGTLEIKSMLIGRGGTNFAIRRPHIVIGDNSHAYTKITQALKKKNLEYKQGVFPFAKPIYTGNMAQTEVSISSEDLWYMALALLTPDKFSIAKGGNKGWCIIPDLEASQLQHYIANTREVLEELSSDQGKFIFEGKLNKKKGEWKLTNYGKFLSNFSATGNSSFIILDMLAALEKVGKKVQTTLDAHQTGNLKEALGVKSQEILSMLRAMGEQDKAFYIYSSDGDIDTVYCNPLTVELALKGKLSEIVAAIHQTSRSLEPNSGAFDLFASRFCLLLNDQSFKSFLSVRCLYPPKLKNLFYYFMSTISAIPEPIIRSAEGFGRWISTQAYHSVKDKPKDDRNKAIGSIIASFESATMGSTSSDDFLSKLMVRTARLGGVSCPNSASTFITAALSGEISFEQTQRLAVIFMRLRGEAKDPLPNNTDFPAIQS